MSTRRFLAITTDGEQWVDRPTIAEAEAMAFHRNAVQAYFEAGADEDKRKRAEEWITEAVGKFRDASSGKRGQPIELEADLDTLDDLEAEAQIDFDAEASDQSQG